ncbi:thioesterase family protein [Hyphomonas sp. KY3]|jgi:4-hydroxybenzoyl-CoA thioesterase|uniref:acyl-CoA thioesterase n=1 Tax=Hyphomonas sp. KY3 TaxID=2016196 RepID=UPI001A9022D7|nr:thioesterase family protein [Hyphomonas sp. KY3]QSR22068.1 hypothetical protein CFA77_07135 [Hyphomonas sp. KY3]|tara:strand:+ start:645 stop:1076 length:432 start_codon:yes stop_codon:yes gene_type:complete
MSIFRTRRKVEWADADVAGIIFYPRYFEMLNSVIDEWFEVELGASFAGLISDHNVGSPMGEVQTRFSGACMLGDVIEFELEVAQISDRTVTLDVASKVDGALKIRTRATHICARRDISKAAHWPLHVREKLSRHSIGGRTAHA